MKKLPEIDVSFSELYRILSGPIQSKLLLTGIELKVFNHLSEPRSSDDVAKAIETHPENTRFFLDGLAASNLVVKNKGLYQNAPITQASLVEGSPTFIGEMFTFMSQMQDATIADSMLCSGFKSVHSRTVGPWISISDGRQSRNRREVL